MKVDKTARAPDDVRSLCLGLRGKTRKPRVDVGGIYFVNIKCIGLPGLTATAACAVALSAEDIQVMIQLLLAVFVAVK